MSTISDALRTEVLYLDGNPDYIVPSSTLAFLSEGADALEAQEARIEELERALVKSYVIRVEGDSAPKALTPSLPK